MIKLVYLFSILSGAAALLYQVSWLRLLSTSIGSTSLSVSIVISAFFLGLALGGHFYKYTMSQSFHPFKHYLFLELMIAVSGFLLLPSLINLDVLIAATPLLATEPSLKFIAVFLLLCIPTFCMGATFPLLAQLLTQLKHHPGKILARLYATNTFGAVIGSLLGGFVLLPVIGLDGTIYLAVTINIMILLSGLYYLNKHPLITQATSDANLTANVNSSHSPDPSLRRIAILVLSISGFCAIATEVAWIKYLSIQLGNTIYSYSSILVIFLSGITLGSLLISKFIHHRRSPVYWLSIGFVLLSLSLFLARAGLSVTPEVFQYFNDSYDIAFFQQLYFYVYIFFILIIPCLIFGAIFPYSLSLYSHHHQTPLHAYGSGYAWNTIAGIAGACITGILIIPQYGTDQLLVLLGFMLLATPLILSPWLTNKKQKLSIIGLVTLTFLSVSLLPALNYEKLIASIEYSKDIHVANEKEPELLFLKEGNTGVISLALYDDKIARLRNNGLNESYFDISNSNNSGIIESLLAFYPYFLHPNPQSAFVLGYGGGTTTRAFTYTDISSIHVVEIEPVIIEAAQHFKDGPITALQDPRVSLEINDARNALLVKDKSYDIISSQPSHPWRIGSANLFSQNFFEIVRSRLNENGIFTQWINLFRMDSTTLQAIIKAFYNVFPHGFSASNLKSGDIMLIGSETPLYFDFELIEQRMSRPLIRDAFRYYRIIKPTDILWHFSLSRQELVAATHQATPNTDTNLLSEVRLSNLKDTPSGIENPYDFLKKHFQYDITSYVKAPRASIDLFDIGTFFLLWQAPEMAQKIVNQLYKLDVQWAKAMEHKVMWWKHDFQQASHWYETHKNLPDRVLVNQVKIYIEQNKINQAMDVLTQIKKPITQQEAQAYLLYKQQSWDDLNNLSAKSKRVRKWQLFLVAQSDLITAGKELESIIERPSEDTLAMRILIAYYALIKNADQQYQWQQELIFILNRKLKKYDHFAKQALDQQNIQWAMRLINSIEQIDPSFHNLATLKTRMQEMNNTLGMRTE